MAVLLNEHITNKACYTLPDGGLAFWIVPHQRVDWSKVSGNLESKGIKIITPDTYSFHETVNGIRLGYGSLAEKQLEEGIIALAKAL